MTPPITAVSPAAAPLPPVLAGLDREAALAWVSRMFDAHAAGHKPWDDSELIDRWLAQCSRTGSQETVSAYRREIRHLQTWLEGNHPGAPLRMLDPVMSENLVADLREKVQAGEMAPRSFNRRLAAWSSLYRWASEPGRSAVSGVVRNPLPRRSFLAVEKVERATSEAGVQAMVAEAQVHARNGSRVAARDVVLLQLAFLSGLRISELVSLRWGDLERVEDGALLHVRRGKGGKSRSIKVSAATATLVESLPGGRGEDDAWLFPSRKRPGQHLSRQGAGDRWRRWGQAVGVKTSPHCFRASHATVALRRGADLHLIKQTLGHASLNTTQVYLAHNPTDSSSLRLG